MPILHQYLVVRERGRFWAEVYAGQRIARGMRVVEATSGLDALKKAEELEYKEMPMLAAMEKRNEEETCKARIRTRDPGRDL